MRTLKVRPSAVVPFFRRLLPLLPAEAHVLIVGRSLPPAPLWRMRSKQTLCLIGEAELAFTPQEAESLFAGYGLAGGDVLAALKQSQGRASTLDQVARRMSGEPAAAAHHVEKNPSPRLSGVAQVAFQTVDLAGGGSGPRGGKNPAATACLTRAGDRHPPALVETRSPLC